MKLNLYLLWLFNTIWAYLGKLNTSKLQPVSFDIFNPYLFLHPKTGKGQNFKSVKRTNNPVCLGVKYRNGGNDSYYLNTCTRT